MDNYSTKTSNYEQNGIVVPKSLPSQAFPWNESKSDDWNSRNLLGIIQRRGLIGLGVAALVMGCSVYWTASQKPIYEGNFQLLVEPVNEDRESRLVNLTVNPSSNQSRLDYESQIRVLRSPELMAGVIKDLQKLYPDINYASLISALSISRVGESKIIEVRYTSNDPKKIKVILDKISDYYLKYSFEKRKTKLRQGIQFVEKQLPAIKNRVDRLQAELQYFRQQYNFFNPESQAQQISQAISTLSSQRLAVDQQLATASAKLATLQAKEAEFSVLNSSSSYQELIGQLRQIELQIAVEEVRYQEENPAMQSLREKRDKIVPFVVKEAQRVLGGTLGQATAEIQIMQVQSEVLKRKEQEMNRLAEILPAIARRYTGLQQDLQIANESLNRFLATRETLQIENAQTELPWELIQGASVPQMPISPRVQLNLLLGLLASLISGVGVALLLEKTDNTFHNVDSIKETIRLPILGILPLDKGLQIKQASTYKDKNLQADSFSPSRLSNISLGQFPTRKSYYGQGRFWESLQELYSNIQLLNSDSPIRSLVMTSSLPGEGKTTIAFHLAQAAAIMGKRVLIVDADLRRPQLHKQAGLTNLWGLTNLISSDVPMEEVIQQLPEMNRVSIITSGATPPDPGRLLSSEKMRRLMSEFHKNFDLVIYDMPPVVGLVDVRLLSPHTDGTVLVMRINKTDKPGLMQALDNLKISHTNVLGAVINGDNRKFKGYNYYYTS